MSSSRSIAAARNRRAIEQQQPNLIQRSRPNTSIAGQPAFSQMQQSPQYQQKRGPNPQQNQNPQNNFNKTNNRNFQSGNNPGSIPVAVNKISVSDAIGLITIRLGRVEQYMQSLDEQGYLSNNSLSGDENKVIVNKEIMDNVMERIHSLENKPSVGNIDNSQVDKLKLVISDLEKEISSLKEILKQQMNKVDTLIIETENKFIDIDNAFVDFEKKEDLPLEESMEEEDVNIENIHLVLKEEETKVFDSEPTFSTINLKNIINQELANEKIN